MHSVRTHKQTIGVILAGGKSSRMGSNKALLFYRKVRLIDHMIALLQKTDLKKIVVSGEIAGCDCISDSMINCGPMGGIYSVMQSMQNNYQHFLFVPVDMPLLTPGLLNILLENKQHSEAVTFLKRPLPLVLNAGDNVKQTLEKLFHSDKMFNVSIKYFLNLLDTKLITIPKNLSRGFINMNTPTDWQKMTELDFL